MEHKLADTTIEIHALLASRWSPRAFNAHKELSQAQLTALLEAARWAPSCFNDQPWRFIVCNKHENEAAWNDMLGCLAEKNQLWAKRAPVLIATCAHSQFQHNGNPNRWAEYDTGAAAMSLCLQANAMGLATHQMGGFDSNVIKQKFSIPEQVQPMAVIAIGYAGTEEDLDPAFIEAEKAPRNRHELDYVILNK